jgi:hypothetical protein
VELIVLNLIAYTQYLVKIWIFEFEKELPDQLSLV